MTESYRERWEISKVQEFIERLNTGTHPKDRLLGGILQDIYSAGYARLSQDGSDTDIAGVMQGILYIARAEERLEFGTVIFAPRINERRDKRLRTSLIDVADSLSSSWSPLQHEAYDAIQQIVLDRYGFRTLFAMTIGQGITGEGSKEIISFAFPNAFREIVDFPTQGEKDLSGLRIAGSFFRGLPFRR